jgi:acetate kinase
MLAEEVRALVNERSGLLGVSGRSSDMRDLLQAAAEDPASAEAVDLFCYVARKFVGALAAVLGGLDTLVFTGGIGEHAAPVRRRICADLQFLGIELDEAANAANSAVISAPNSRIAVRVIPTDEDLMIARHTSDLLWP